MCNHENNVLSRLSPVATHVLGHNCSDNREGTLFS